MDNVFLFEMNLTTGKFVKSHDENTNDRHKHKNLQERAKRIESNK